MKKFRFALFLGLVAVAFAACNKDTYQHGTGLIRPQAGSYALVFADQTLDSVCFYTYDSYAVTTDASYVTVDSKLGAMKVVNNYWNCWEFHVPLTFTPNTTGETREAIIKVNSYGEDDWNATLNAGFLQLPTHNIVHPAPDYGKYETYPKKVTFELKDSADVALDSLKFYAFDAWTLSQEGESFVHMDKSSGSKGTNVVKLTLDAYMGKTDRSTRLTLKSSNGVATEIKVTQLAVK